MTRVRITPEFPGVVITDDGRMQGPGSRGRGPTWLQFAVDKDGYQRVSVKINGRWVQRGVHTVICTAFHGPKPSRTHQAAHFNGVKSDNRASNLRWSTPAGNTADALRLGEHSRGVSHYRTRLTEQDVRDIRQARREGVLLSTLARRYGVTNPAISAIANRRTWKHIA